MIQEQTDGLKEQNRLQKCIHTYMGIQYDHRDQWETISSSVIDVGIIDYQYGKTKNFIQENLQEYQQTTCQSLAGFLKIRAIHKN